MRKFLWVIAFVPSVLFGQPITLESGIGTYEFSAASCAQSGGNLFVSLGDKNQAAKGFFLMTLNNFQTVEENTPNAEIKYQINHPTKGKVNLFGSKSEWELNREAISGSNCKVTAKRAGDSRYEISVTCQGLSQFGPVGKEGRPEITKRNHIDLSVTAIPCEVVFKP